MLTFEELVMVKKNWEDALIPQSLSEKVITNRGNHLLSRVCDLIDPSIGDWDEELVNQTFWHVDAQRILAIPLPVHELTDFVAWSICGMEYDRDRYFHCTFCPHVEWEHQYGHKLHPVASSSTPTGTWDLVWSLHCP